MSQVIEILRSLDRKERFAVLREALGFDGNAALLDSGFRDRLSDCIDVVVPETAFVAVDYHLDWIEIALLQSGARCHGADRSDPEIEPLC